MKYFILILLSSLFFISCGPSREDIEKEIQEQDSLMEPERDSAIETANDFILGTDSTETDSSEVVEEI